MRRSVLQQVTVADVATLSAMLQTCMLQRVAVCCSALQCVAVCRSVLQCVAVRCSVLQRVAVFCGRRILLHRRKRQREDRGYIQGIREKGERDGRVKRGGTYTHTHIHTKIYTHTHKHGEGRSARIELVARI